MKKWIIVGVIFIAVCGAVIFFLYGGRSFEADSAKSILYSGKLISDIYTDKSIYRPGNTVKVEIDLNNGMGKDFNGRLYVYFKHLYKTIDMKEKNAAVKGGEIKKIEISWDAPAADYTGYMVEACAVEGEEVFDSKNTAVNVSSDWSRFPVYGYLTDFPVQSREKSEDVIQSLSKFHINGLEFYDWQDKHNKPLPDGAGPGMEWKDIANRVTSFDTVKDYIDLAHEKNIKAANYNLIYGAYSDYLNDGVKAEWGLYKDSGHNVQDGHNLPASWESSLKVFDPVNPGWQEYIFGAENITTKALGFDVWHMDTLGNRGLLYDYNGNLVDLPSTYRDFIDNAGQKLGTEVVFNTVNCYGLKEVAGSGVNFLYSELWPDQFMSYSSLKRAVDMGNNLTHGNKKTVLAAYMNYKRADSKGKFNDNSVRLADAVIFAAGGSHIELGDTGMLGKEYFPNNNLQMTDTLCSAMRNYYDFLVGYENLLRDGLTEVDNKIEIDRLQVSDNGEANTIWAYSKEKEGYEVIQLINLNGIKDSSWRDDYANYPAPSFKTDLKLKYYTKDFSIKNIYLASPDIEGGKSVELNYTVKENDGEKYVEINIPELYYWDMIYVEK